MVIECAIYKSLSLAANELFDKFDFEDFFEKTLIPRVEQVQSLEHGKLVHRLLLKFNFKNKLMCADCFVSFVWWSIKVILCIKFFFGEIDI